jgi:hypothetical protein
MRLDGWRYVSRAYGSCSSKPVVPAVGSTSATDPDPELSGGRRGTPELAISSPPGGPSDARGVGITSGRGVPNSMRRTARAMRATIAVKAFPSSCTPASSRSRSCGPASRAVERPNRLQVPATAGTGVIRCARSRRTAGSRLVKWRCHQRWSAREADGDLRSSSSERESRSRPSCTRHPSGPRLIRPAFDKSKSRAGLRPTGAAGLLRRCQEARLAAPRPPRR